MALYSKKEFADICGMPKKTLAVYVTRSQVIVTADGMIDDQNPVNNQFKVKYASRNGVKKPKSVKTEAKNPDEEPAQDTYTHTLRQKAIEDLENKRIINQLKTIEVKKKLGQVVPTDSVKSLIQMHSENIKSAYIEASDNLIVIYANKGGMNATDIAEMRKKFVDLVNKAVDKAVDGTKVALTTLVTEFSEKRGVGQHD